MSSGTNRGEIAEMTVRFFPRSMCAGTSGYQVGLAPGVVEAAAATGMVAAAEWWRVGSCRHGGNTSSCAGDGDSCSQVTACGAGCDAVALGLDGVYTMVTGASYRWGQGPGRPRHMECCQMWRTFFGSNRRHDCLGCMEGQRCGGGVGYKPQLALLEAYGTVGIHLARVWGPAGPH